MITVEWWWLVVVGLVLATALLVAWAARRGERAAVERAERAESTTRGISARWSEFEVDMERHRRAGTWPSPGPHARQAVDREEREARGIELTRALGERMARGMGEVIERTFGPWP